MNTLYNVMMCMLQQASVTAQKWNNQHKSINHTLIIWIIWQC